jgi:hypothetical protein
MSNVFGLRGTPDLFGLPTSNDDDFNQNDNDDNDGVLVMIRIMMMFSGYI